MQFGWITIGVAVIVAMRGCLVFWRHMEGLHVVLIGDPVGFEINLALKCVVRSTQVKCVRHGLGTWGWSKSFFIWPSGTIMCNCNNHTIVTIVTIQWEPMNMSEVYKFMRKLYGIPKHLLVELFVWYLFLDFSLFKTKEKIIWYNFCIILLMGHCKVVLCALNWTHVIAVTCELEHLMQLSDTKRTMRLK